jgi:RNA binding exosome subunit
MKYAHSITISAFCKPEEDLPAIKEGLIALVPLNLEESKIKLEDEADTFEHRTIHILRIILKKLNHTNQFTKHFLTLLSEEQKKTLLEQEESRIDEEYNFFIRISKTMWSKHKMIELTDSGDCYHIKFTLACYPKNRNTALALVKQMLS